MTSSRSSTKTKPVFAEMSEDGKKVEWYFRPDRHWLQLLRGARGRFVPVEKGGPYWTTPLDFDAVRELARSIGAANLQRGAELEEWAWRERGRERAIRKMLRENRADLTRLPELCPDLYEKMRDDQRVGVAFSSLVQHPLIRDKMGLGKTWEAIGTVFESGIDEGPHLVVAPVISAEEVWEFELQRWQPHKVFVCTGEGMSRGERESRLSDAAMHLQSVGPGWVIVNPDMIAFGSEFISCPKHYDAKVAEKRKCEDCIENKKVVQYPFLHETRWNTIIVDEASDAGLRHAETFAARGFYNLSIDPENGKRIATTGTPYGGRPINLWGILHFLDPVHFSSKWAWIDQWLEVEDDGYGKKVGGIRPDRKEAFDLHLLKVSIGREKKDVLKDLPEKDHLDVWCEMTPKQAAQYEEFAKLAEVTIGEHDLSATSILAEYTRLKQFAGALQEVKEATDEKITLRSLPDSGKLNRLVQDMVELGILDHDGRGKLVPGEDQEEQIVIFSQFSEMVDMVYDYLLKIGVPILKITGATTQRGSRRKAMQAFQGSEARVMVMTTKTGGVSITLDRASNVAILDEMWDPDKQEQAEDRCHRASRIHQVTVRYYRSRGTVEEYIKRVTDQKKDVNDAIQEGQVKLYGKR